MKPKHPGENDESLRQLLRGWSISAPLPPRFQEAVWRRIERAEFQAPPAPWAGLRAWIERAFARPSLAVAYVSLLLLAGLVAGYWQTRVETVRLHDTLGQRYVQMVDPYQTPRH
ncbi:MAG: hypothetical protein HY674_04060 [Chloroflexi bacterium]|nr:hypothetical protein [Chloroflexota bacterium]